MSRVGNGDVRIVYARPADAGYLFHLLARLRSFVALAGVPVLAKDQAAAWANLREAAAQLAEDLEDWFVGTIRVPGEDGAAERPALPGPADRDPTLEVLLESLRGRIDPDLNPDPTRRRR